MKIGIETRMKDLVWYAWTYWYAFHDPVYGMLPYVRDREFGALVPSWCSKTRMKYSTRNLREHNAQGIEYIYIFNMRFNETPGNLYYSMAKYRGGFPVISWKNREEDKKTKLSELYLRMVSYDFLIDIDADTHEFMNEAKDTAGKVMAILDRFAIPYELRFSGMGFHIVVPGEAIPLQYRIFDAGDNASIYKLFSGMATRLKERCGVMVDTSVYDSRRLCKLPYSVACYEEGGFICTPLSDLNDFTEAHLFRIENMNPRETRKKYPAKVFNRGGANDFIGMVKELCPE